MFAAFAIGSFFMARGQTEVQLALLTGALAIGSQLWKVHGTGVYVAWYYGFLLLGFLGHRSGRSRGKDHGPRRSVLRDRGNHFVQIDRQRAAWRETQFPSAPLRCPPPRNAARRPAPSA